MGTFSSPLNTAPAGALTEATLGWADSQLLTPSRWMVRPDSLKNIFSLMAFYVRQSDWMPHGALPESLTCIFVPSKCSKCSKNSNNDIKSGHRRKSYLDWGQWSLTSQALVFFLVLAILTEVVVAR